jgi:protein-disulfide isomerase
MNPMAKEFKIKLGLPNLTPVLLVLILVLGLAVAVLWQKVTKIEKSGVTAGTTGTTQESPLSVAKIKGYAKELKLNTKDFNKCLDEAKFAQKVKDEITEGGKYGVSGTPAFLLNGHLISGALPYEMFQRAIDFELKGGDWAKPDATVKDLVDPKSPIVEVKQVTVVIGDAPTKGDANAKVTLVEFSDFECPYCERFYTQTFGQIESNYVNAGKVLMAFKQFPLGFHQYAQKAAEASLCAKEQGKFWEMHNKLFEVNKTAGQ